MSRVETQARRLRCRSGSGVTASHCTGYSLQPRRGSPDGIDSTDSRPRKPPIARVLADREAARWGKTSRPRACQPVRTPPGTRTPERPGMDEMQDEAMQDGRDAGLDEHGGVALIKCGLNESEDGSGAKCPVVQAAKTRTHRCGA